MKSKIVVLLLCLASFVSRASIHIDITNSGTSGVGYDVHYNDGTGDHYLSTSGLSPGTGTVFGDSAHDGWTFTFLANTGATFGPYLEGTGVLLSYSFDLSGTTNCSFYGTIKNTANFPAACYVTTADGQHFLLSFTSGGSTLTFHWNDPSCTSGGVYTFNWVINGNFTATSAPDNQAGGSVTPVNLPVLPQLGDTFAGTANPYTPPSTNNPAMPPPVQPYVAPSLTNANTNGPINFGTNTASNPTNLVNNGTVQQGDGALFDAITKGDSALLTEVQKFHTDNNNGLSNAVGHLASLDTNMIAATNYLRQIASNTVPNTNVNSQSFTDIQTAANAASADGAASLQGVADSIVMDDTSVTAPSAMNITIGTGALATTVNINPLNSSGLFPAVSTICPWIRFLSTWAMTAWFVIWLVGEQNQVLRLGFLYPQAKTADAPGGIGFATALLAAGFISIALNLMITAVTLYLTGDLLGVFKAHPFGASSPHVVPIITMGIGLLDAVFNIPLAISLIGQRALTPFLITKTTYVASTVIRFIVG